LNIFHELAKKPWLSDPAKVDSLHKPGAFFLPAGKVGLKENNTYVNTILAKNSPPTGEKFTRIRW